MNQRQQEYSDYIHSDEWKEVKRRYLDSRMEKNCYICHEEYDSTYHLHHKTYAHFGHESLTDLCLVCPACHSLIHWHHKRGKLTLWQVTTQTRRRVRKKKRIKGQWGTHWEPIPSSLWPDSLR